jgi:hypothetical protein
MISNDIQAQKVVYTFEREEDGKTNKVMRIWSINEDKLYTLAYIAESSQYDRHLPAFQRMVDSFTIDAGSSIAQEDNNERSSPPPPGGNCDRISYPDPDVCIPPYPPDLNCPDIPYKNFEVTDTDPHGFDRDNDGLGCESENGGVKPPPIPPPGGNCDRISYPDPNVCIPPFPPDLNCGDVSHKNFKVTGSDPHGFDRDNDGIGCESANGGDVPPPIPPPNLPICDENTPPETPCIDEGDPDDPPICTPDGPPCPPCPEGVEAGWCADEDERRDFDCGDPDMENDPRCENGEPVNGSEEEEGEGETTEEPEEEEGSQPEGSEGSTGEGETGAESPA